MDILDPFGRLRPCTGFARVLDRGRVVHDLHGGENLDLALATTVKQCMAVYNTIWYRSTV